MGFNKSNYKRKKYSFNQRLGYHNKRVDKAFASAKDSEDAFNLFKKRDIAYSSGFVDAISGQTQFSVIADHGGNEKAYKAGEAAGIKALAQSWNIKF